jgi:hypothetical protein
MSALCRTVGSVTARYAVGIIDPETERLLTVTGKF